MSRIILIILVAVNVGLSQEGLYGLEGWYDARSISMAGTPGTVSTPESNRVNPAGLCGLQKQAGLNIAKYPAGINAQSLAYILPFQNSTIGVNLRHLNYGDFTKIDENGTENGSFSASDTWLSGSWSKVYNGIQAGISGGLFVSSIYDYSAVAAIFSVGGIYDFDDIGARVGLSMSNAGMFIKRYTDFKEKLPTNIIISGNKKIKHLPLNLNADIAYSINSGNISYRIGGIFKLPYQLNLSFGINSDNLDQRTEYHSIRNIVGSSGIGLSFKNNKYLIEVSAYTYGTGGLVYGSGFGLML